MLILPNYNIKSCEYTLPTSYDGENKPSPESSKTIDHLKYVAAIVAIIVFALAFKINYEHAMTNKQPQNLLFHMNGYCLHVHHWLISIIFIGLLWIHKLGKDVIVLITAMLIGFCIEGLLFKDRFNFKCHNPF